VKPLSKEAQALEEQLKKQTGAYTLGDFSTITGMPTLETKYALVEMMGRYKSQLSTTENGDLIYDFGEDLQRRDMQPFREKFMGFLQFAWKGFKVFYKALIAVMLVVYFVVFVLLVIALVVAMASANKGDSRGRSSGGGALRIVGSIFESIFWMKTHNKRRYKPWDKWGYPYEHYEPRRTHLPHKDYKTQPNENPKNERLKEKSFIASIYDFVFGPPRIELHPLKNRQEVASYLRQSKGLISTSEVQALAGWTRGEASEFLTNCISDFDGDATLSQQGTIYGEFDDLIRAKKEDKELTPIEFFWDEYEPEYELTGNSTGKNAAIIAMNAFNLALSGYVLSGGLAVLGLTSVMATVFLGVLPMLYSLVFFLVPAIRSFYVRRMQRKQHIQNIRKRLMKVVFVKHKEKISLIELTDVANKLRKTEEKLDAATVQATLEDFIVDLDGHAEVDENGNVVYDFRQLNRELTEMEEIRDIKILDANIGDELDLLGD